jgi:PAS domain S-box-containing protein
MLVGLALLSSLALHPRVPQAVAYLFLASVVGCGWSGGRLRGILAAVVAALTMDYFFLPPIHTLGISRESLPYLLPFLASALAAAWMSAARTRLEAAKESSDLLADVGKALTRSESLQQGLEESMEILLRHIRGCSTGVWILNEPESLLELSARAGGPMPVDNEERVPVGYLEVGSVASGRKPNLTNDVVESRKQGGGAPVCSKCVVAFAGYPVMVEDRLLGVVATFASRPLRASVLGTLASTADMIGQFIERKRAQEVLRQSEEQFRQLAENIREVFYIHIVDPPRAPKVTYVSSAYEQIWGRPCQEVYEDPMGWIAGIHPEDRATAIEKFSQVQKGIATDFEYRVKRPDGEIRWIRSRNSPVRDPEGRLCRTVGVAEDITARKQAEEELLFKTALLEAQSETMIDGILVVDESDTIVLINQQFARVFAVPEELVRSRDDRLLLRHVSEQVKDTAVFIENVKYLYDHRNEKSFDEISLKDGRILDRYSAPLVDAHGKYAGRIWYFRDITQRKSAEEQLYRSRQMLQSILDNIPQRVFWKDRTSVYLGCNQGLASDAGLSCPAAIVGKSDFDLVWRAEAAEYRAADAQVMEQGQPKLNFEELRARVDGSMGWLRTSKVPLRDSEGNVFGVLGTYEDVTERKRMEIELRQAQKLEAVGQLAAGIAHEINTPIQFVGDNTRFVRDAFGELEGLLSSYQRLREAAAGKVDGRLLEGLDRALERSDWDYVKTEIPRALEQTLDGVGRVASIVRAMKEFSHVDRSGQKAAADLNRALESTLLVARNELKYVADVFTDFGDIPPVICHLGDLNQVFLNLLVNASHAIQDVVKGTGQKGTIRVKTSQEGQEVVVAVSDTGTGIPPSIREKIFDPFFTTKEVGRGTGQGLALARGVVVDRHTGSLTFETEPGKGTTFFVRLPINPRERKNQEQLLYETNSLCGR